MKRRLCRLTESTRLAPTLLLVSILLQLYPTLTMADPLPAGRSIEAPLPEPQSIVKYRIDGREVPLSPGDWVPSNADIFISVEGADAGRVRAVSVEIVALEEGERVLVEVPGLQEWDKQTRKWIHTDLEPDEAASGRWIWSGTFRPGDRIVIQWRDVDSGLVIPHPVTLRIVDSFGAKLAFATPVSIVFPVTGDATVTASAGFSMRYYRISNRPFWRTLERIGFPAIAFSYATIGGRKSVLYSIGISAIDDQLYLSYGGFRNSLTANNFWMIGLSLKTSDLMAAAKRALK